MNLEKIKACITPTTPLITMVFIRRRYDQTCEYCAVGKLLSCIGVTDEQLLEIQEKLDEAARGYLTPDKWWDLVFSFEPVAQHMEELRITKEQARAIANENDLASINFRARSVLRRVEELAHEQETALDA
jgi:hypothetical protein